MRCSRVHHLMSAYLEDSLAPGLAEDVSQHLARCLRCQEEETVQRQAMRFLNQGRHAPSIDLWADFSRRLQQQAPQRPPVSHYLWQPGLASALAALVVGLVARSAPVPATIVTDIAPRSGVQVAAQRETGTYGRSETAQGAPQSTARRSKSRPSRSRQVSLVKYSEPAQPTRVAIRPRTADRRLVELADSAVAPTGIRPKSRPERVEREQPARMVRIARALPQVDGTGTTEANWPWSEGELNRAVADPLDVAEALVEAQQDSATDRVRGQLLLLAREVARVGGGVPDSTEAAQAAGT